MELNFHILRRAFDAIKIQNLEKLRNVFPGLVNPRQLFVKRVQEDDHYLTVEFRGFENAVETPHHDMPLVKRAILHWLRRFSTNVQIQRGAMSSLIVRIDKNMRLADDFRPDLEPAAKPLVENKYEKPKRPPNLTNIVQVRPVRENQNG